MPDLVVTIDQLRSRLQEVEEERDRFRIALERVKDGDLDWHRMLVPALPTSEDTSNGYRRIALAALAALEQK